MISPPWNGAPAAGSLTLTSGGVPTVIGSATVSLPGTGVRPSLTVSVAVYAPGAVYVCDGSAAVDVSPSPKSHRKLSGSPSASAEPALVNCTTSGAWPCDGVALARATGGWFDPVARMRRTLLSDVSDRSV
jgi:hypothetical protein